MDEDGRSNLWKSKYIKEMIFFWTAILNLLNVNLIFLVDLIIVLMYLSTSSSTSWKVGPLASLEYLWYSGPRSPIKAFFPEDFFYFTLKLLKCQNELKNLIWLNYIKYLFMFLKGSFTISYLAHNVHYPVEPKDFQAFRVGLVRRLTSAEFAFLFMVSKPYVL